LFIDTLRSRGLAGRKKDPDDKGFTLVELLVVITILGILAAVVVFSVSGIGDKGEEAAAETDSSILATAQEAYCAKNGSFADPSILQRDGFLSSESGYNDAYVDTTQGSCGGMSFALFQPKKTDYPVTIADCLGRRTTYEAAPGKALAAYSSTHETMAWLELLDKTVAPAPQDPSLVPDQLEDEVARGAARNPVDFAALQYTTQGRPLLHDIGNFSAPTVVNNFAAAAADTPADLIIFDTPDHVSTTVAGYDADQVLTAFNGAGKNGQVYVGFGGGGCTNDKALSDPNNPNSPLVDLGRSSLEGVFANIRNLGVIFDVQEKAAEVIAQMRSRIGEALNKAGAGRGLQVAATFPFGGMVAGFSNTDLDGEGKLALFPGNHSMNGMINLAGGKNIFADTFLPGGNPGSTSAAQIVGRNPDVVVLAAYAYDGAGKPNCDDNFFGGAAAPSGTKAKLVGTTAIGDAVDANDRVVCHYFGSMVQPSISSIEVIEAIADELAKGPKTKEDNDV
jgi:prepilin-type N-terminal cleavage/methylation domain-containing protein